ncbi:hypothetical protein [Mycobacterium sp. GA-2829]|uniref:hypothetical protein n=1 Tax=Mycobacterium sp. GA-2829 TaxID=1772283 RepID=UPI00073FBB34|nr:hypothetical protein [Mycobacterium sp. GA-2829]KUI27754.1 hypothetical protein AU194_21910 [Mycobacterium sp. GA-2829]
MTDDNPDNEINEAAETDSEIRNTEQAADGDVGVSPNADDEPDTFPRAYVEDLRQENGKYRQRAQKADVYAQRLHTELVRATGRLADPTDMPFDEDHLAEPDKMTAAIDDLLARKPHLASRRPVGDIGQGVSPPGGTVDLAAILRGKAS